MRLSAVATWFVALFVVGCSYSVEGSGKPVAETKPQAETPAASEGETPSPEPTKPAPTPEPKPADIKGVSVVIDGVDQGISEGVVTVQNAGVLVTLRRRGDTSQSNVVHVSVDHVGKGCSRRDDLVQQGLAYYPSASYDSYVYIAPTWEGCALNILQAEKTRGGRIVGVYDGELLRANGESGKDKVHAVVKFSVTVPTEL
jgi:hypothetical protein